MKKKIIKLNLSIFFIFTSLFLFRNDLLQLPAKLIETKAYQIIEKIKANFENIEKCKVEIKKINPPINGDVSHVSVIVEE